MHQVDHAIFSCNLGYYSTGEGNLAELRAEDAKTNVSTTAQRPCRQCGYPEEMSSRRCVASCAQEKTGWFGHVYRREEDPLPRIGEVVASGRIRVKTAAVF